MDFDWNSDQRQLRKEFVEFATSELNDDLRELDSRCEFSRDKWFKCAEFGVQGLAVPSCYGGQGKDVLTAMFAMEGLGYGCRDNGLLLALNAQMWTVQSSILHFGSERQKEHYLPALCDGRRLGAYAITEAEAGSDAYRLQACAVKQNDGYVLNGRKILVTLGPLADIAIVFATVDSNRGMWGITAFLVDASTEGYRASGAQEKMGLRTVPLGEVSLENCYVPSSSRLGAEGTGAAVSNHSLEWERSCMLASYLGAMQRQLEEVQERARARQQFGQTIGKFQAVAHRIVDMKLRLEAARLLVYKVAWLKMAGKPAALEAALAKLMLSESFVQSSLDAIRVFGGGGYLTEMEVERNLRDAVGGILYGGTSDIQRNIVARLLGL